MVGMINRNGYRIWSCRFWSRVGIQCDDRDGRDRCCCWSVSNSYRDSNCGDFNDDDDADVMVKSVAGHTNCFDGMEEEGDDGGSFFW
jgi:hypothetical protein